MWVVKESQYSTKKLLMRVSMQMCTWPQVTCRTALVLWEELQMFNQKPCLPLRTQGSQEMLRPSARGYGDEREARREGHCSEPGTQRTPHKQLFREKWRRSHPRDTIYWSEKVGEHHLLWKSTCCCCFRKTKVQK